MNTLQHGPKPPTIPEKISLDQPTVCNMGSVVRGGWAAKNTLNKLVPKWSCDQISPNKFSGRGLSM